MRPLPILLATLLAAASTARGDEILPNSAFDVPRAEGPPALRREGKTTQRGAARIADVSFPGVRPGTRIRAYLVTPRRGRPRGPAVLWVHWLGEPETTNRTEFLGDAVDLAGDGVVSLLIDAQWAQPRWFEEVRGTATDRADSIRQVQELRLALDVLERQPGVDRGRIAFVGHDFGGMYGSILARVDGRPRWYVIMAVTTKLSDWFLLGKPPGDREAYLREMAPLEPLGYLRGASPHDTLFQFARKDRYVTAEHAGEYVAAAPGKKQVEIYDADHALEIPKAHADRLAWLRARLGRATAKPPQGSASQPTGTVSPK